MPLFYQQNINGHTRLAVWKIEEPEDFFLRSVALTRAITHPHKRLQHLAGRYLLPFLFPDFPHAEIEVADTRKPFLRDEQYHFSISHCGGFAAAIASPTQRVGIDIEMLTPRVQHIQHKFLHPEELHLVHTCPPGKQIALLTLLWSAKEAMYKWWSRGDVDFSEMLRLEPFVFGGQGLIDAFFIRAGRKIPVQLSYIMYPEMSLCWVVSG
ncbi:4'-phosphopantetheinyl transferase family protein [Sediminibacterium soli]|uniref:4'-phosphopantetheinyl transferase family protein n=1 Tax=Sediminibacterium soli TaxID=2698829 RepID=UPI00137B69C5|nr:4'-phosphopantetheinyl transferase superfamily protein [Sediminibacterium soli]NCI47025.1 4'-phosphopantetheinyl transferase superfamily protein [Sediminibacterium soli]